MSLPGPSFSNSTETHWWDELAAEIEAPDDGPLRHSAEWYAAMRDAHAARFPDADERSKQNMRWRAVELPAWTGNGIRDGRTKVDGNRVEVVWSNRPLTADAVLDFGSEAVS